MSSFCNIPLQSFFRAKSSSMLTYSTYQFRFGSHHISVSYSQTRLSPQFTLVQRLPEDYSGSGVSLKYLDCMPPHFKFQQKVRVVESKRSLAQMRKAKLRLPCLNGAVRRRTSVSATRLSSNTVCGYIPPNTEMADRVSLVGLAGSMAIITHGVTMSLQSLSQLRDRYSEVDLTVLNLMAQLSTLRRVLTNIRHWIMTKINLEGDLDHQLVMDLDVSMKCCKLLVCKIGMLTGKFVDTVDDDRLDIKDLRRVIEQQTNALELLLSACNW